MEEGQPSFLFPLILDLCLHLHHHVLLSQALLHPEGSHYSLRVRGPEHHRIRNDGFVPGIDH